MCSSDLTLTVAGDSIDTQLLKLIEERYPQANVTVFMVREWKEKHSFVGNAPGPVVVTAPVKGVPTEQIDAAFLCTYQRAQEFFSHRRDNGLTGRMAAVIQPS